MKSGSKYWGGDRLKRMVETRNLENEPKLLMLDKVPVKPPARVLDVGCGIGRRHIYFKGWEYIGVDREKIMIDNGRKYFPNLYLIQVDATKLENELKEYRWYFDLVFTYHVLQYNSLDQQDEIIKGIRYVLKPRGFFLMKENTIYDHNNIGYKDLNETHSINKSSYTEAGWIAKLEKFRFSLYDKAGHDGYFIFRKK